jgi:hypothetical protein
MDVYLDGAGQGSLCKNSRNYYREKNFVGRSSAAMSHRYTHVGNESLAKAAASFPAVATVATAENE